MVTCLPVSRSYCVFMSSRAFFKLAAANTTTSRGCCAMLGPIGISHALAPRLAITPSSHRRRARFDDAMYHSLRVSIYLVGFIDRSRLARVLLKAGRCRPVGARLDSVLKI